MPFWVLCEGKYSNLSHMNQRVLSMPEELFFEAAL